MFDYIFLLPGVCVCVCVCVCTHACVSAISKRFVKVDHFNLVKFLYFMFMLMPDEYLNIAETMEKLTSLLTSTNDWVNV